MTQLSKSQKAEITKMIKAAAYLQHSILGLVFIKGSERFSRDYFPAKKQQTLDRLNKMVKLVSKMKVL